MQPRDYQLRVSDELWAWFQRHPHGDPIVEAAVGAGKSLMIAMVVQRADAEYAGTRAIVVVHQKELLEQNVEKLLAVWPRADVGIYSAAKGKKQLGRQLTYATIGSVYKQAHRLGRIDLVLCDECHLISPKDAGMWRSFIGELRQYNPHMRVIGWTGTPFRGNGVWLTAGDEALFTSVATRVPMRELLDRGYLTPLVPAATTARIDTSGVRTSGDDYVISELARAADQEHLVRETCAEIVRLGAERQRWLVFAVTIEHAEHVRDELRRLGVAAEMVSAETPKAVREVLIRRFRGGEIRCLVNVAVLTTGFDVPAIDFIALLRATKSPVLYVQIAGRGMRLSPGKTDCLWADFTDTTSRLGPVDAITGRLPTNRKGDGAPVKLCETCGSQNPTAALFCVDCGAPFPPPERIKHGALASDAAVLSDQASNVRVETVPVAQVRYRLHAKDGSPDSVRVEYMGDLLTIAREWVCFSHEGYARVKAERWWRQRAAPEVPVPGSTDEALEWIEWSKTNGHPLLREPREIVVNSAAKYPEILQYRWE